MAWRDIPNNELHMKDSRKVYGISVWEFNFEEKLFADVIKMSNSCFLVCFINIIIFADTEGKVLKKC